MDFKALKISQNPTNHTDNEIEMVWFTGCNIKRLNFILTTALMEIREIEIRIVKNTQCSSINSDVEKIRRLPAVLHGGVRRGFRPRRLRPCILLEAQEAHQPLRFRTFLPSLHL